MKLAELFEKQSRESAWVIVYTASKLILGKRSPSTKNPNQWNFFGGSIDKGESPLDAAVRELEEEGGYKVSKSSVKSLGNFNGASYFSVKVPDEEVLNTSPEISKIKSFKLTDLPDNLHAKTASFFDNLEKLLT